MEQERRTLTIIWLALMGGVAMYTAIAFILTTQVLTDPPLDAGLIPLVGLAVIAPLTLSFVLRRVLVDRIPPGADDAARVGGYRLAVLVSLAIAEGAGLLLVTAAMMGGTTLWVLAGGVGSVLVMAMQRPDLSQVLPGA